MRQIQEYGNSVQRLLGRWSIPVCQLIFLAPVLLIPCVPTGRGVIVRNHTMVQAEQVSALQMLRQHA